MDKFYLFSKNEFLAKHNSQSYTINSINSLLIEHCLPEDKIEIEQNFYGYNKSLILFPNISISNNFYNVLKVNNDNFIELISTSFENVIQEINLENCCIKIYLNAILLFYNQKCYSFAFKSSENNYALKVNDYVYVFNGLNLIKISLTHLNSTYLIVENFSIIDKNIEILCKFPKSFTYFLLFCFNLNNNNLNIKKLKNERNIIQRNSLPYVLFYLCKFDFEDAKNVLSKNIELDKIKNYLSVYDEIIEIDNTYFLYSKNKITNIFFNIQNNVIEDID